MPMIKHHYHIIILLSSIWPYPPWPSCGVDLRHIAEFLCLFFSFLISQSHIICSPCFVRFTFFQFTLKYWESIYARRPPSHYLAIPPRCLWYLEEGRRGQGLLTVPQSDARKILSHTGSDAVACVVSSMIPLLRLLMWQWWLQHVKLEGVAGPWSLS